MQSGTKKSAPKINIDDAKIENAAAATLFLQQISVARISQR